MRISSRMPEECPLLSSSIEIDAVGRPAGAGLEGGHDEREQTHRQLLVEMDGFEGNEGSSSLRRLSSSVVLDPALLRVRCLTVKF